MTDKKFAPASLAAQAMGWIDPVTRAVVPPIHMASTYLRDEDNSYSSGRIYARADNPTFDQAEATLAALQGVDSTVATPVLSRPIGFGADIVMHSATKYLNGHSDLIAGALIGARDDAYWAKLRTIRAQLGTILGQTEAWLLMRGMRALYPRVQWACPSAQTLAARFAPTPLIPQLLYPGLPSFAGHAMAKKQMTGGFSGM